jgi:uncharacterized protein YggE
MGTLLVATAIAAAGTAPAQAQSAQEPVQRTITVSGDAFVTAKNDTADFTFGVSAVRTTATAAQSAASAAMARVIRALKDAGVKGDDIQTDTIELARVTVRVKGKRVRRFKASQSVDTTVRDLSKAGSTVDAAVKAGATEVAGPEFSVADTAPLYARALTAAFDKARVKAQALAERAGGTLGEVISISESSTARPEAVGGAAPAPSSSADTPVEAGTTQIEGSVTVTFALR